MIAPSKNYVIHPCRKDTINAGRGTVLVDDPTTEISSLNCREVMQPRDFTLALDKPIELPPASVTSLKLSVA